jgi:hypothetical protein
MIPIHVAFVLVGVSNTLHHNFSLPPKLLLQPPQILLSCLRPNDTLPHTHRHIEHVRNMVPNLRERMQKHASQLFERLRVYLRETAIDFNSGFKLSNVACFIVGFLDEQIHGMPSERIIIGFYPRGFCHG